MLSRFLSMTHMLSRFLESESLSSSPFVSADLTICTRIGVSSPSSANRPDQNHDHQLARLIDSLRELTYTNQYSSTHGHVSKPG